MIAGVKPAFAARPGVILDQAAAELFERTFREGMDLMYDKPEKARITILEGLRSIQELARILPNSMYLKIFFNAKVSELVDIFKGAPPNEKNTAFDLLISIDPANRNRYEAIKAG